MELTQNLWERYGFTANTYDTKALSFDPLHISLLHGERGRRSPDGGGIVVEGEPVW